LSVDFSLFSENSGIWFMQLASALGRKALSLEFGFLCSYYRLFYNHLKDPVSHFGFSDKSTHISTCLEDTKKMLYPSGIPLAAK